MSEVCLPLAGIDADSYAGSQNRDLPSPASNAVHSSGESPGSTRSAAWHHLLADWESLPSTRGAPVRLPPPSTA